MSYRYLEDVSSADVAFEASGSTPEELFREAAAAVFEVIVDTKTVKPLVAREVRVENGELDGLLVDWLSELVFLKDSESLLFSFFNVKISRNGKYVLNALASGEIIDRDRHAIRSDVKAVTYHLLEVKKKGNEWTARVVLDI